MAEESGFDIDARIAELERELGSGGEGQTPGTQTTQAPAAQEFPPVKEQVREEIQTNPEPQEQPVKSESDDIPDWVRRPGQPVSPQEEAQPANQAEPQEEPATVPQSEPEKPEQVQEQSQTEKQTVSAETPKSEQDRLDEWSPEAALQELKKENQQKEKKASSGNTDRKGDAFKKINGYIKSNGVFDIAMLIGLAGVTMLFMAQFAYLFLDFTYESIETLNLLGTIVTLFAGMYFVLMIFMRKLEGPAKANTVNQNRTATDFVPEAPAVKQTITGTINTENTELSIETQQKAEPVLDERTRKQKNKLEAEREDITERQKRIQERIQKSKSEREKKNLEQELHDIDFELEKLDGKLKSILETPETDENKNGKSLDYYGTELNTFENKLKELEQKKQDLNNENKQFIKQSETTAREIEALKEKLKVNTERQKQLKQNPNAAKTKTEPEKLEEKIKEQENLLTELQTRQTVEGEQIAQSKEKITDFDKTVHETRDAMSEIIAELEAASKGYAENLKFIQRMFTGSLTLLKKQNMTVKTKSAAVARTKKAPVQNIHDVIKAKKKS